MYIGKSFQNFQLLVWQIIYKFLKFGSTKWYIVKIWTSQYSTN